jgi:sucrose phosphorylase
MPGCHDGILLPEFKGLLPEERIERLIETVVTHGGMVKDLHGQKNVCYQVNAAYFGALGEDEKKLLLARALRLFMPGKPQVWYLDLFAGKNDTDAVKRGGSGGHKESNRTNLTNGQVEAALSKPIVKDQLSLLRQRNACPAFGFDSALTVSQPAAHLLTLQWAKGGSRAALYADLETASFRIETVSDGQRAVFER